MIRHASSQTVGQAAADFFQLRVDGSIDGAFGGMNDQGSRRAVGIGHRCGRAPAWLPGNAEANGGGELRMHGNAIRFGARETLEDDAGNGGQRVFIDAQLAMEHAPGDQQGELHDVLFGAPAQVGPHPEDLGDGGIEALQNGLRVRRGPAARPDVVRPRKPRGARRRSVDFKLRAAFLEAGGIVVPAASPGRVARFAGGIADDPLPARIPPDRRKPTAGTAALPRPLSTLDNILFAHRTLHSDDAFGFQLPHNRDDLLLGRFDFLDPDRPHRFHFFLHHLGAAGRHRGQKCSRSCSLVPFRATVRTLRSTWPRYP